MKADRFAPPSTPPRLRKGVTIGPSKFGTLKTPQSTSKKVQNFFSAMNSGSTNTSHQPQQSKHLLAPITPEFTPHKSPRLQRRKKIENIFKLESPTASVTPNSFHQDHFGLLLPTPSTIGSGRKSATSSNANLTKIKPAALKFDALTSLNNGLKFETDMEEVDQEQPESSDEMDQFFLKPTDTTKFISNSNLRMLKSPTRISRNPFEEPSSPVSRAPDVPSTPGHQMINDFTVHEWYGNSAKYFSDDEADEEQVIRKRQPMVNPFLSANPARKANLNIQNPFNSNKSQVDYSTHLELVNNKTGEKKIVRLSERQAHIRPKKLDFSSA
ncbi:hypothetical protein PSN45_003515 [Yamadazyma tenuis]|uniref:Uncharacterized protein n=1 Tax=Candida tenuis (strain ATCC 10573 / BCRC 21748 / CBS 615 / JCM 9827 / NBRC 10315 / NRRL Y-1498 / VKM Y-70) TaxID=590646 RepID=G3AXV4_CANTC|nr:uncharacterized protein CANTEDRAFT_102003 [Yamadazyma tenuis ATCC 10573]EGV65702.1 hypothetical protein CANTEDRAFT_102003 [Yamadazyma tenuis ATCC 10573]WEJ95981.1 hypothetical protein PSN45_003515 [Yamadazyma tenuis]